MTRARAALLAAATLLVLVAARSDLWPGLRGPAPYPPEWQWGFEPKRADARALAPVVVLGAGLLGLVALAQRAAGARSSRLGLLAGAALLGWGWQLALLDLEPAGAPAELESRTLSGSFTSHFKVAAGVEDAGAFLSRHHELLPGFRRGALHSATHPPGPILYYRGILRLMARLPSFAGALGGEVRAAAIVGAAFLGLLGAAACFPVAALARALGAGAAEALRAGVLWAAVPGLCLMVPELDQALALPVAGAVALIAAAVSTPVRGRAVSGAVAAGLLTGLAVFFSYGAPLLVALGAAAASAPALTTPAGRRRAALVLAIAAAVAVACFLVPMLVGHQPLASATTALAIHREQFTARRSYPRWLLFNLVDLAVFLGAPVVLFGLWGPRAPFRLVAAAGVAALVASGLIRGEMGRILIPMMPVLLVACVVWPPSAPPDAEPSAPTALVLAALLAVSDVALRLSWELP